MKIMFISLGCDKNLVDTEMMLGMLAEKGYQFTDDEQEAEIVVVNTCCFIGDAKEESINTLIEIGLAERNCQCQNADRSRMSGTALPERDPGADPGGRCDHRNDGDRQDRGSGRRISDKAVYHLCGRY